MRGKREPIPNLQPVACTFPFFLLLPSSLSSSKHRRPPKTKPSSCSTSPCARIYVLKRKKTSQSSLVRLCFCARFLLQLQVPYAGLNFAVYESLKDWMIKSKAFGLVEDNELGIATRLACGAEACTVGQTVAYPLDVIRRRMQMVGWHNAALIVSGDGRSRTPLEYTGMIDAFRKAVRHEGFRALYWGFDPQFGEGCPFNSH